MTNRLLAFTLLHIIFTAGLLTANDSPPMQVRVFFETKTAWVELRHMGLDQVWRGAGYIEIVTDRDELDEITSRGFKTEIVHENLTEYFLSRMPDKTMGAYKTLDEIYTAADQIIAAYPSIVSARQSIGLTLEGRDIYAVKVSDNHGIDEDEPEVLYTSAIHAREVITPEVLLNVMDYLTQNYGFDPDITDLIDNRELWFILVANPDGYYYNELTDPNGGGMWRKNRRNNGDGTYGVDLNRNFGYMWGLDDEGSSPDTDQETYRGTAPFSEPESQVLRDFNISRNFTLSVYYHSYSNLIIWPWSFDRIYCPDNDIYARIGDTVNAMNGYAPGPGWILYLVNGDTDDWNYGEQTLKDKIFSFTVEVGSYEDNFWPPANSKDQLIGENLEPSLFYARVAGDIYKLKAPSRPDLILADSVNLISYTVEWSHNDTLNPAAYFELIEMTDYQVIENPANSFGSWDNIGFTLSGDRYASTPTSYYSGSGDDLFHYISSDETYLVKPGDTLTFNTYYDIETNWDYAYVDVSTDGINFYSLAGDITTDYDPYGSNHGNGITGSSGGWVEAHFDLADYVGQEIYIRLTYLTDTYVAEEGIYFDDVYPFGVFGTYDSYTPVADTFYTITGQAEGEYFYKVRGVDAEGQVGDFSDILVTYATTDMICGDTNGDESVDIADAVYLINFVFKGGPTPDPWAAGDANGDGDVNIADGVYLINYVFKGGPAPVCQ